MFWHQAKAKIIHWYCGYRSFFSVKNNFICLQKRSSSFFSPEDPQNALPDRFGRFNTWVSIGATQKSIRPCLYGAELQRATRRNACAFTSSSLTLRWWRPRSSGLRSEGSDCRRTWSGTGRSSRRPRRRCCCRAAREPRVRSRRWWFGSAAGKESTAGGSFKSCWTVCLGKVFKLHHGNQIISCDSSRVSSSPTAVAALSWRYFLLKQKVFLPKRQTNKLSLGSCFRFCLNAGTFKHPDSMHTHTPTSLTQPEPSF